MTLNPQAGPNPRFDLLLQEVLHEYANPEPMDDFVLRLQTIPTQERGLAMTSSPASFAPSSILWSDQNPTSGWNLRSLFGAALVHAVAILLIAFMVARRMNLIAPAALEQLTVLSVPPPPVRSLPRLTSMGGGGGHAGPTPVTRGNPPKFAVQQLNAPKAPPLDQPKIAIPVTIDIQPDLNMAHSDIPRIGIPDSPLVGISNGGGHGTGLGSGSSSGMGPGEGGNTGGGLERIGGSVSAPIVLFQPEPEFSEEARKAKVAGNVLVYLQVDRQGHPQHVRVLRGIGLGLDEKAVAAVRQYKFKPAMKDGRPVPVEMNVEVNFQIF